MSLAEILASTVGLTDLPALAFLLGFEPTWHPLALSSLRIAAIAQTRAAVIGRRDGIVVLGLEGPDAERIARTTAVALARRGTAGLVIAADPAARRLAFAPAAAECPVAAVAATRVRPFDLELLDRARQITGGTPLTRLLGWAEALSGRSLDDRFFRQFRVTLFEAADALPKAIPPRERHALALLDLTRVLFLYFVQARGWLDGRPRFLREELDRALSAGGKVEQRLFAPLFFGTLNTPRHRRTARAGRFGKIPFLNGGLFEPHPLERRWPAPLPDIVWRDGFDRLFERYHFTLREADAPGAIGPDMLGRVFEGVMDPEVRRETGAFYTPARLVDQVVDRTLTHWLAGAIGGSPEDAAQRLRQPDADTVARLGRIAVLDPAVGSGAFLLGVLRRLVATRVAGGERRSAATRAVIATNLFGVDRNPNAVHLAELRLWLEVIEADEEIDPEQVEPLPNLDALIRQGDSVLERLDLPFVAAGGGPGHELAELRSVVVSATGGAKRTAITALRRAELRAARAALDLSIERIEGRIAELLASGRSRSLFGERMPLPRGIRTALEQQRRERRQLRAARRRLAAANELPWFHYASQFADVIGRGGFDLVVGNPPWVRAEALTPAEREALKRRFRWFRSAAGRKRGFAPLPDLSVAFLERGFDLLGTGGVLGFLIPAKLTTAQYGTIAREALARAATLHVVADLRGDDHGFDAVVYPLMLVAGRAAPGPGHRVATGPGAGGATIPQASLGAPGWDLRPDRIGPPARALLERHPTVADRFRIRLGVKTGADRCFFDPPATVEPELIRPALRGRDIEPFRVRPSRRLLWTHDRTGRPLATLPPGAATALAPHLRRLRARADHRIEPAWTLFRIEAARGRYRVVWPDLARDLEAAALITRADEPIVPLNTCYTIAVGDPEAALALTAWLNATPIRRLAKRRATVAAAGFSRFNADLVGGLPFPDAASGCARLAELARRAIDGVLDQEALDARAIELLGFEP